MKRTGKSDLIVGVVVALASLFLAAPVRGQTPADIVGMSIACSNDKVYVWYANGTVTIGTSSNLGAHQSYLPPHPYNLPAGKTPGDIIGIGIAGNDHVYVWYKDGTASSGTSTDLDRYRVPYRYSLAPGKSPADVVGIDIACSNDHVYVWYRDGRASSGTSSDLDEYRSLYSYSLAPGKTPDSVVGIGIAGNDHVYAWYRDKRVSSGTSSDLDEYRPLYSYAFDATPSPGLTNPSRTAFDLSVNSITPNNPPVDDNGIWLNPIWAFQTSGRLPNPNSNDCRGEPYVNCTTQSTTSDNSTTCRAFRYGGHHNWAAGTYTGRIFWDHHSCNACDDDYNFLLVPPDQAGLTTENDKMKIEFSADETIYRFHTPWWDSLDNAVGRIASNDAAGGQMIDGRNAIVTGLVGLDCAHGCRSELHPAWAMAIQARDDPSDEMWALFVRRWGNEGFCSNDQHYLEGLKDNTYTFRLPWRSGATSVSVLESTIFRSRLGDASGPQVSWAANEGVLVSFTMQVPRSGEGEIVHGELHLQWTGAFERIAAATPRATKKDLPGSLFNVSGLVGDSTTGVATSARAGQEEEPEARMARLLSGMTPDQRKSFEETSTISPDNASVRPAAAAHKQVASLPARVERASGPTRRAAVDAQQRGKDRKRLGALRAIYGDQIP